jgi:hypothetical protein
LAIVSWAISFTISKPWSWTCHRLRL